MCQKFRTFEGTKGKIPLLCLVQETCYLTHNKQVLLCRLLKGHIQLAILYRDLHYEGIDASDNKRIANVWSTNKFQMNCILHFCSIKYIFISASLGTEESMYNVTQTAVCNLSEIYWCSKRWLFSC